MRGPRPSLREAPHLHQTQVWGSGVHPQGRGNRGRPWRGLSFHVPPSSAPQARRRLPRSRSPSSRPPPVCIPALNSSQGRSPLLGKPPGLPGPGRCHPRPAPPRPGDFLGAAWPPCPRPAVAPGGGTPGMRRQQLQGCLAPDHTSCPALRATVQAPEPGWGCCHRGVTATGVSAQAADSGNTGNDPLGGSPFSEQSNCAVPGWR